MRVVSQLRKPHATGFRTLFVVEHLLSLSKLKRSERGALSSSGESCRREKKCCERTLQMSSFLLTLIVEHEMQSEKSLLAAFEEECLRWTPQSMRFGNPVAAAVQIPTTTQWTVTIGTKLASRSHSILVCTCTTTYFDFSRSLFSFHCFVAFHSATSEEATRRRFVSQRV